MRADHTGPTSRPGVGGAAKQPLEMLSHIPILMDSAVVTALEVAAELRGRSK